MKTRTLFIACLSIAAFTVGCKKADTNTQQLEQIREKTETSAQDLKDYTYSQKSEFVTSMKRNLDDINRDLDKIAANIEKSGKKNKAETQLKLKALREQTAKLNQQLDEMKNATESSWDDFKAGFNKGYQNLKGGFNDARQWVSDAIEPASN